MGIELQGSTSDLTANPLFVVILVVLGVGVCAGIALIVVRMVLRRHASAVPERLVTLLVTVPKEEIRKEGDQSLSVVEVLQRAEGMFANLGGLRAQRGVNAYLRGRTDHFALEVLVHDGEMTFSITVPRYMQTFMAQQIHAQVPNSQIEEVPDRNIFQARGAVAATALTLKKPSYFPIQTYRQLESDPMESLTSALSKAQPGESILLQYVIRSARGEWHRAPAHIAREMQQGKSLAQAMRDTGRGRWVSSALQIIAPSKKNREEELFRQQQLSQRKLSPMEEQIVKRLEEKTSKAGFDVNIRVVGIAQQPVRAQQLVRNVVDSFGQYAGYEYGNSFKPIGGRTRELVQDIVYRRLNERKSYILNAEEVVSLFHFPLPTTQTPNIRWLTARSAPPPVNMPREGLLLGTTSYRGQEVPVRITREDRRRHIYVVGKSGVGKSVLLQTMAIQDIQNGEGVCVIDPHGDLVEAILRNIPRERVNDVVVFDPSDLERPMGLNMLEVRTPGQKDFVVQEMIAIFYKLFPPEMIGPMFEHNMRNVMLTLMEDRESPGTIVEIPRMFTDKAFQKYKLSKVTDPVVRQYWEKEVAQTSDFHKSEMLGYLISKVGRFVENEMMRNIIGQPVSGFDFRDIMDRKRILLVNLSKGKTGEVNSSLLGLIIVAKLQMAALGRADLPEEQRSDFYLYIDEFQNFVTDSITTILSEARKYKLNLIIAHQYLGQLVQGADTKIRDAVFGNAGTMVAFRVGVDDAETMAQEFAPVFTAHDVINMDKYTAYLKLLIDNTSSKAFNMRTYPPTAGDPVLSQQIRELSRLTYGRDRRLVAAEITERTRLGAALGAPAPGQVPSAR